MRLPLGFFVPKLRDFAIVLRMVLIARKLRKWYQLGKLEPYTTSLASENGINARKCDEQKDSHQEHMEELRSPFGTLKVKNHECLQLTKREALLIHRRMDHIKHAFNFAHVTAADINVYFSD